MTEVRWRLFNVDEMPRNIRKKRFSGDDRFDRPAALAGKTDSVRATLP